MKNIIPIIIALLLTACSDDSSKNSATPQDSSTQQQDNTDPVNCELKCVDNISYFCNEDGTPGQRDCGELGCNQSTKTCNFTAPSKDCEDHDAQCDGDTVETCVDGRWEKEKTPCPNGCKDGQCLELICNDDDLQCNGNKLEICSQNQWMLKEDCPNGCDDNTCSAAPCDQPGTMIGDYLCDGEIITYKTCETVNGTNVVVDHQAVSLCHENNGITQLMVCTNPNDDDVFVTFDWKTCAKACTTTPETETEFEYAACDDIHYGGPFDADCDDVLINNCDLVDKICVSNNLFYDCVAPCRAGDPDTIRCEITNDAQTVARKVSCMEYKDKVFGYGVLEENVCTGACTNGQGCQ